MNSFTIKDKEIDIKSIMKKINKNIEEKKESGVYKENEIKNISEIKIDLSDHSNPLNKYDPISSTLEGYREYLNDNWESLLKGDVKKSHRKFIGPLIGFIKMVIFNIMKPFAITALDSQARFNSELVKLLNFLLHELERERTEVKLNLEALGEGLEYLNIENKRLEEKHNVLEDKLNS